MLKSPSHTSPRVINVDQNKAYPPAVEELKDEGVLSVASQLRQCKYLNKVLVQIVSDYTRYCGKGIIQNRF
jgi:transposase, IS6 family